MRGETPAGPRGAAADRRPFDRVWPWAPVAAAVAWGAALGLWGVLRSPGGGAPPPPDAPATWARVAQVGAVMGLMLFVGLLAWRRHGPRAGAGRPALENGLVAFGVPFGAIMGIHQALLHVGGLLVRGPGQRGVLVGARVGAHDLDADRAVGRRDLRAVPQAAREVTARRASRHDGVDRLAELALQPRHEPVAGEADDEAERAVAQHAAQREREHVRRERHPERPRADAHQLGRER
jgi:hypothetical protein